ncbi:hypothetical protein [Maliponia aquimaris]|uniref:Ferrochelatase n=1 Tax=Maliponia aquimaris TaxID=1673631 RepID=A0A238JNE4_9RHOB|nr:hypothetical protein [Maliponia aquimaris]SMX32189.1 hypothetical protein MAA8898_00174 [Maliponia aquimaris]
MKKLMIIAAAAAITATAAAPVAAQQTTADPFIATQTAEQVLPLVIIGTVVGVVAIAAASGTD